MDKETIRRLAREAGLRFSTTGSPGVAIELVSGHARELERFVEMVAAHEREECAKVCDNIAVDPTDYYADTCSDAIRARSNP